MTVLMTGYVLSWFPDLRRDITLAKYNVGVIRAVEHSRAKSRTHFLLLLLFRSSRSEHKLTSSLAAVATGKKQ